jgi:hypothetical protein
LTRRAWYRRAVADLGAANRRLEAQRAMLTGDDHVRREVAPWRDASPNERLAAAAALCRDAVRWLDRLAGDELERALAPDPLPDDAAPILRALRGGA